MTTEQIDLKLLWDGFGSIKTYNFDASLHKSIVAHQHQPITLEKRQGGYAYQFSTDSHGQVYIHYAHNSNWNDVSVVSQGSTTPVGKYPIARSWSPPVGSWEDRMANKVWPGNWYDATGFASEYTRVNSVGETVNEYHTGVDLNLPSNADYLDNVWSVADGIVVTASKLRGTWGFCIITKHWLPNGDTLYVRYAHLSHMGVNLGQEVKKGQWLAKIGKYDGQSGRAHLHLDFSTLNNETLFNDPNHWPGSDLDDLKLTYQDPALWFKGRLWESDEPEPKPYEPPVFDDVPFLAGMHSPGSDHIWNNDGFVNMMKRLKNEANMPMLWMSSGTSLQNALAHNLHNKARDVVRIHYSVPSWKQSPQAAFKAWVDDQMAKWYNAGFRRFIVYNEPNLGYEGLGKLWDNPSEFADHIAYVLEQTKKRFPDIKLGTTPMAPGGHNNAAVWNNAMASVLRKAPYLIDFWAAHSYVGVDSTGNPTEDAKIVLDQLVHIQHDYRLSIPIMSTETSFNRGRNYIYKAAVYLEIERLAKLPEYSGITEVFYFISHWNDDPNNESWFGNGMAETYLYKRGGL